MANHPMFPSETFEHPTDRTVQTIRAWSLCANPACQSDREITARRVSVQHYGVDSGFQRMVLSSSDHLAPVDENGDAFDAAYTCSECGKPCIVTDKPRREVAESGYAHPQQGAWDKAKAARGA